MSARISEHDLENLTHRIGSEFFDTVERSRPTVLQSEWWNEWLMGQWMRDEWLKVQTFRLIDALPALHSYREIARHLREYLAPSESDGVSPAAAHATSIRAGDAPNAANGTVLRNLISGAVNFSRPNGIWAACAARFARTAAIQMAHRFIAGQNPREAEHTIRTMRNQQLAFTIDVLGEAAVSESEAEQYHQTYLNLINELSRHAADWGREPLTDLGDGVAIPKVNVSVKLTSIYSKIDAIAASAVKSAVKERLRPLLRAGMAHGAHIHVDMEHYAVKDITLDICREVLCEREFRDYPHFGIVLQAYLKDGDRDVADTVQWVRERGTPIWVRLVKGAYWDTETVVAHQRHWPCPVWRQKWQSDACYERMTRVLLENHEHICGAFASHNIRSLSHALALRQTLDVPRHRFELQMLYGMGDPLKRACVRMGERCRVYTPYGEVLPGMAYFIRRLLENTSNESFLRHTAAPNAARAQLLKDPALIGQDTLPPVEPFIVRFELGEPIMDPFENVADTDFTIARNRESMQAAIQRVRAALGRDIPLVIDGRRVHSDATFESHNPARPSEVIGRVSAATTQHVDQAVQSAAAAFKSWRLVSPQERADYLFTVARLMQERRFDLAALQCLECAKPWREADADVSEAIDFCNYYAREMLRLTDNIRRRDIPGETNEYWYAPRGVAAVIQPWNFPLAIPTGMTAAAIVTGNTVVLKPSQQSAVIAAGLVDLFEEAGLPSGVLNFLPGRGAEIGDTLVRHPQTAMIAFTGSREVGCRVNQTAAAVTTSAPGLKKVIAEMGGKNAIIIDADADLDEAIKGVVQSAFGYAGQKCSAASRCIVLAGCYERFVERLVEAVRSISVGPGDEPGTFIPPVIDASAAENIRQYIEIGRGEAHCALSVDVSQRIDESGGGNYVGPTIFTDVPPDARIAQEEIFGPVLAVIRAADMDEAIEIFNGADFALTGGIYSRSPENIDRARSECECGNLYINRKITGALVDLQPFGGFRMSGTGSKAGGPDYLTQFCEPRTVTENTLRRGFAPSEDVVEAVS